MNLPAAGKPVPGSMILGLFKTSLSIESQSRESKTADGCVNAARVLQLIIEEEVEGRIDNGSSGRFFGKFDPANILRGQRWSWPAPGY